MLVYLLQGVLTVNNSSFMHAKKMSPIAKAFIELGKNEAREYYFGDVYRVSLKKKKIKN